MLLVLLVAACGQTTPTPIPTPAVALPSSTPGRLPSTASPSPSAPAPESPQASAAPSATIQPATSADWPQYHRDAARTGLDPGFRAPDAGLAMSWKAALDGAVYAEPLVVGGAVIAATEGDSVYALDPTRGSVLWRRHLGSPVPLSTLPCGNIDPLGITGTPAYDPATASLFVVAEVAGPKHVLFALDPANGAVRWSRSVDLPGSDPLTLQQRPALAVGSGFVYIGFGGLAGDCGQYRGAVVGVPTNGAGPTIAYRVPVSREGGVWATGGPVLDPAGNLYVSIGNGASTTTYDGSDSVVELSPTLELKSRFAPARWARDNAGDADLGSLSPVLVPGGWVFIAGKSGQGYVLRQGDLGGIGGQVSTRSVCAGFGAAAQAGATLFVPCPSGVEQVRIGSAGSIHPGWVTGSGATGPPVIGAGAVWSLDITAGRLVALDPATGAALASVSTGALPHFASPSLWGRLVLVGTMHGVLAVRVG